MRCRLRSPPQAPGGRCVLVRTATVAGAPPPVSPPRPAPGRPGLQRTPASLCPPTCCVWSLESPGLEQDGGSAAGICRGLRAWVDEGCCDRALQQDLELPGESGRIRHGELTDACGDQPEH